MSPRSGGFKDDSHRCSCRDLLAALLESTCKLQGGFRIDIDLTDGWSIVWPRPQVLTQSVPLVVNADGTVCWLRFVEEMRSILGDGGCRWHRSSDFSAMVTALPLQPTLLQLFEYSIQLKKGGKFHEQLLWHTGWQLQSVFMSGLKKDLGDMSFAKVGMDEAMSDSNYMDLMLVKYTMTTRALSKGQVFFSCCTDKSSVGGLGSGVQNCIFALQPNTAFIGVPQVVVWKHLGLSVEHIRFGV